MHIGLIGGIGPAATDYYYQSLINACRSKGLTLDLTMVHADSNTLLENLAANNKAVQVEIYERLANRLVRAGADCVVVTSIAGHFCIEEFKPVSKLPVIDMIEETNRRVEQLGYTKIGILGTRTVMESRFYGGIKSAQVKLPQGSMVDKVHEAYVSMATAGYVSQQQRNIFDKACDRLLNEEGVEAILLGGTDLALVYQQGSTDFPIIDCAALHCEAVLARALNN